MKKIVLIFLVASSILMANGWKIPETSTNAVALGAANIAHNHNNADAAYYNPAKMVFMSDENNIEVDVTYIHLDKIKFTPTTGNELHSESENVAIPTLHYVSPKLGESNARVGLSIVAPAGLSKRWKTEPAKASAEEFTLEVIEVNPTVAFEINDKLGFAVGFRIVQSSGVVKSSGTIQPGVTASRDMTGESVDFGYNFALAYNPVNNLELGLTYRSKVELTQEGNALLNTNIGPATYNGSVTLTVPIPATLSLAAAYTLSSKTTVELVYERTYWSAYQELDFNYPTSLGNAVLIGAFDNPKAKNWKDTNTFRLGLTQELTDLSIMAGLVIDETPVPEATVGYELPGTDTVAVSLGGRYKINDKVDVGLSVLYSMHDSKKINNSSINGDFTDGNILIISAGLGYKF